jgi:hypothetical protein
LRPGLRIIGFERRVTIVFHITKERVIMDRILYGGQDIERRLSDEGGPIQPPGCVRRGRKALLGATPDHAELKDGAQQAA